MPQTENPNIIRDIAQRVYRVFLNEEPQYAAGALQGFADTQEAGTTKELAFILQELKEHFASDQGVIHSLADDGNLDRKATESFYHNNLYAL